MQLFVYAAVGLVATLAHIGLLVTLVEVLGTAPTIATATGALAGAMVAFIGNRFLTFGQVQSSWAKTLPRFMLVALAGAALNATIVWGLMNAGHWHYLAAQFVATGIALVLTFQLNRAWTFDQ